MFCSIDGGHETGSNRIYRSGRVFGGDARRRIRTSGPRLERYADRCITVVEQIPVGIVVFFRCTTRNASACFRSPLQTSNRKGGANLHVCMIHSCMIYSPPAASVISRRGPSALRAHPTGVTAPAVGASVPTRSNYRIRGLRDSPATGFGVDRAPLHKDPGGRTGRAKREHSSKCFVPPQRTEPPAGFCLVLRPARSAR